MKTIWLILLVVLFSSSAMSAVWMDKPELISWDLEPDMITPKYGFACVEYAGMLFLFWGNDQPGSGVVEYTTVSIFDGEAWIEFDSCPDRGFSSARAVVLDGYIYIIGGYIPSEDSTNKVWRYNPMTDEWHACESMPGERVNPGIAVLGGKIYVFGGRSWSGWTYHNTVYVYDPTLDYPGSGKFAWSETFAHPGRQDGYPLGDNRAVQIGGKVYLIGGYSGTAGFGYCQDEIWRFDPDAETAQEAWILVGHLPEARSNPGVELLYGYVTVVGGATPWNGSGYPPGDNFWLLDPETWELVKSSDLPVPFGGNATGVLNGRLYFFGNNQSLTYGAPASSGCWSWRMWNGCRKCKPF